NGKVDAVELELSRSSWKQPVRVPALSIELTPAVLKTKPFAVESGATKLEASAQVEDYTKEPKVDARLRAQNASLEELLNMAAAYGAGAADVRGTGNISIELILKGPVKDLTYAGSGSLTNASLQVPALTVPIKVDTAKLRFEENSAVIEGLSAAVGLTKLKG